MKASLSALLFFIILYPAFTVPLHAQFRQSQSYENGLVVTEEIYASEVGKQILQRGGNAIDAAVAVQFALAVTLPQSGNIGGGGFMIIHLEDGSTTALDFRESIVENSRRNNRRNLKQIPIPGTVDGMVRALERHGRMPLELVLQPAIDLARNGFYLSYQQAQILNAYADEFYDHPSSITYFLKENGVPFKEGDLFMQKDLANVLEQIAQYGRDGFYSGDVADKIIQSARSNIGSLTRSDLYNYRSIWRTPIQVEYDDYTIHTVPSPSLGGVSFTQTLQLVQDYPVYRMGHNSANYIHLISEALNATFSGLPTNESQTTLSKKSRSNRSNDSISQQFSRSFSMDTIASRNGSNSEFDQFNNSSETTHFSVIDKEGNAVSVTTTLNGPFGSFLAVEGAGFLLSKTPSTLTTSDSNRLISLMAPSIVSQNGKARLAFGATGGKEIVSALVQTFLNQFLFKMNTQEAISAPRFHHKGQENYIYYEAFGISPDTQRLLLAKGHKLRTHQMGRVQMIYVDHDGLKWSGVDPRSDGFASGY